MAFPTSTIVAAKYSLKLECRFTTETPNHKTNLILIGGCAGTQKTTLAYKLATELKIDKVLSLDVIKTCIQNFVPALANRYLFTTTQEAHELENLSVMEGFKKHAELVQAYLLDLLGSFRDDRYIIVEGAQLTPDFVAKLDQNSYNYMYFNMFAPSTEALLKSYTQKQKMRNYPWQDHIDEIWEINEKLRLETMLKNKQNKRICNVRMGDNAENLMLNIIGRSLS